MTKRYFSLDEVNQLVPRLVDSFGRIMQLRGQLRTVYRRLEAAGHAPESEDFDIGAPGAPDDALRDRAILKGLIETLHEELARVEETGCLVKDLETGLCDWFAQKDGRDIFLCWRYGEKRVDYWHEVETGFAGRRPVEELE